MTGVDGEFGRAQADSARTDQIPAREQPIPAQDQLILTKDQLTWSTQADPRPAEPEPSQLGWPITTDSGRTQQEPTRDEPWPTQSRSANYDLAVDPSFHVIPIFRFK